MSYAIISIGGKQYRVHEGERLLVDRIDAEDGKTFAATVLLVGGDGEPQLAPSDVTVTARVLGQRRGPKIRIGKYRRRTAIGATPGSRGADADRDRVDRRKEGARLAKKAEPAVAEKPKADKKAEKPKARTTKKDKEGES